MSEPDAPQGFPAALAQLAAEVEDELARLLPRPEGPELRLHQAMRYATLGGGKRLRAFLVTSAAALFGVGRRSALRVAAAVELVHTYSLVHDDLPAMDDDELRRGRAATHIEFDEASAILTGDALLTLAFEVLAEEETHSNPEVRSELIVELATAAGCRGMVAGQIIDLAAERTSVDVATLTRLHQLKTGALIAFACTAGAILGRAPAPLRQALHAYAHDLGLAYQIVDDLLDAEGDTSQLGKPVGSDAAAGKSTFVSVLGPERARTQARMLAEQAIKHLDPFAEKAELLRDLTHFVIERRS
ncbi:MAG: polyprenyl synthetase family protein [Alphaproteobacteria bacterium]|nr:polyprenyl synthetase family protein [Alphaproteobacteria bacterium]